jgi:alpha-amylase/alpha-mannosidase (GH57 family)
MSAKPAEPAPPAKPGTAPRLYLALYWHMHQPDYRDMESGQFRLPWTYLHALKDYSDMAAHLEAHAAARAVFNFVPILLDQIEDYAEQCRTGDMRDPLLDLLRREDLDSLEADTRELLLDCGFRCNHERMVAPYPAFSRLRDIHVMLAAQGRQALSYLSGQYLADLVTWYHLVWTGETVRRAEPEVQRLMAKGEGFTLADRMALFEVIGRTFAGLIPRYRALEQAGRIEISTTPYAHPIAPLLLDFRAAREAEPDMPLPEARGYPGGAARVARHIELARATHQHHFGSLPDGMWPAEGGVSSAFVRHMADAGLRWCASGGGVLRNSLEQAGLDMEALGGHPHRPFVVLGAEGIACFFRDEGLSDKIGFEYAKWHGDDAVADFVHTLEQIAASIPEGEPAPIVSVILDGENAWEYYPYNGYYFLDGIYQALEDHAAIRMTTFRDYLETQVKPGRVAPTELPALVAGSWVYGSFTTWMGDAAKNRAWDLLAEAKACFDLALVSGRLDAARREAAEARLLRCESSDWFWWFGDYNPAESVAAFDRLFRLNLTRLYEALDIEPPARLLEPISRGSAAHVEAGGAMRRAH